MTHGAPLGSHTTSVLGGCQPRTACVQGWGGGSKGPTRHVTLHQMLPCDVTGVSVTAARPWRSPSARGTILSLQAGRVAAAAPVLAAQPRVPVCPSARFPPQPVGTTPMRSVTAQLHELHHPQQQPRCRDHQGFDLLNESVWSQRGCRASGWAGALSCAGDQKLPKPLIPQAPQKHWSEQ